MATNVSENASASNFAFLSWRRRHKIPPKILVSIYEIKWRHMAEYNNLQNIPNLCLNYSYQEERGHSSVYGRTTGWTVDGSEFESRYGQEYCLLHRVQTGSGNYPASCTMGTGAFPRGVKKQGHEADYSHSSSSEFKNVGPIPLLPHTPSWLDA
jgi:hypothetical protein